MTDRVDRLVTEIRRLTARELAELKRRLNDDLGGSAGVPVRPAPTPPPRSISADAVDRSVTGRTIQ